jgi:hypothetical protein
MKKLKYLVMIFAQLLGECILKNIKAFCVAASLLLALPAHAALINVEPNIFRDTATNLEWLGVSQTTTESLGLTDPNDEFSTATVTEIMTAVSGSDFMVNQNFRLATSAEVTALYAGSGEVLYYDNNDIIGPNVAPEIFDLGTTQYADDGFPFGVNSDEIIQSGLHAGAAPGSVVFSEVALYITTSFDAQPNYYLEGVSHVLSGVTEAEYASYYYPYGGGANETSVYLVRTAVPVPPAVLLFGSGLLALWRFKKSSV